MLGPLLLGNYMGTSSTQEFTQAEVVHAVYFYPYLSIFLLLNILKDFPCVLKQRRTHLSVQWRYSQEAAGKRFVPVNGMKQIKIQSAWPWATITTVFMLMEHGTQNVAMLQCPPTTTVQFRPHVKTTW